LARYDHESRSWRTCQGCLDLTGISDEFSGTWPSSGMMLAGRLYELPTLELRTSGEESGLLLPTPSVRGNHNRKGLSKKSGNGLSTAAGGPLNPTWVELLMGWPLHSTSLQPMCYIAFERWLMGWTDEEKTYNVQEVSRMRRDHDTQTLSERPSRRLQAVDEAKALQSEMCEHEGCCRIRRSLMESKEAHQGKVRELRWDTPTDSASHQREQRGQLASKHRDSVCELSHVTPPYGKKAWAEGSWEDGILRVADGVANRIDRLRALGNGQVPAVATRAFSELSR
jgi:DNA (cytosine-5)-methyltransferase 1